MKKLLATIATVVCLTGCSVNHGNFTVLSNQVVDLDNINLETAQKTRNVVGESVGHIIILIPAGDIGPQVESSMDDAFHKADGDLLVNAHMEQSWFYIPYIYGRFLFETKGDMIKTRK